MLRTLALHRLPFGFAVLALALALSHSSRAQTLEPITGSLPQPALIAALDPGHSLNDRYERAWKWSLAPLFASQALDTVSSYGAVELNPLLADHRGAFGMKATTIKLGVAGAFVGVQYLVVKSHPRAARVFSKLNWVTAILTTGLAAHNFAVR